MTDSLPERFQRAKARFLDGLEAFNAGRWADAEAHYRASLDALPGRASTLINLAATQLELGRPEAALATADQALEVEPDGLEGWLHRATALARLNRFDAALPAYERLLEIDPGYLHGWLQKAMVLERLSRPRDALAAFERALAVDPASIDAWSGRGGLLRELGRSNEAAHAYREAIRHGADPVLHAYYLASVEAGGPAPAAAPSGYVAALFDDYADEFDAHLVGRLGYDAPARLIGAIPRPPGGRFRSALDLGCGTGLCGPLLRPLAERLTGIDLAPRMVEKARARGLYDRLEADEIVAFLDRDPGRHDLVVAADVFIYFGDLAPVYEAVRRRLDPGGVFCFTVEASAGPADYALQPSLRYAHAEAYLRRLADAARFESVALRRLPVRQDQRVAIEGSFVYLRAVE